MRLQKQKWKTQIADFMDELKPGCELWKVICELEKLSENANILYRPFKTLSPGERTKAMLAILFSEENDFLLVDEPTIILIKIPERLLRIIWSVRRGLYWFLMTEIY